VDTGSRARVLVKYESHFQNDSEANDFRAVDHDLLLLEPSGLDVLQCLARPLDTLPYGIIKTFRGFGADLYNFCNTHIPCSVLMLLGSIHSAEYTDAMQHWLLHQRMTVNYDKQTSALYP
jgi:hypothetical protein